MPKGYLKLYIMILQLKLQKGPWNLSPSWKIAIWGVFLPMSSISGRISAGNRPKIFFSGKVHETDQKTYLHFFHIPLSFWDILTFMPPMFQDQFQITTFIWGGFQNKVVYGCFFCSNWVRSCEDARIALKMPAIERTAFSASKLLITKIFNFKKNIFFRSKLFDFENFP